MDYIKIGIKTEYIKLDQFLKWCGVADTGGIAHDLIVNGDVKVNGEPETRRGRKIRTGDRIELLGKAFEVCSSGDLD